MKKYIKLFTMLLFAVTSLAATSCSDSDEGNIDLASQVAGVYTGKLMINNAVVEDAYAVYINKVSTTVVAFSAPFMSSGSTNFNVVQSGPQLLLKSETEYNINITITGKSIVISYLSQSGSIVNYNGTRD